MVRIGGGGVVLKGRVMSVIFGHALHLTAGRAGWGPITIKQTHANPLRVQEISAVRSRHLNRRAGGAVIESRIDIGNNATVDDFAGYRSRGSPMSLSGNQVEMPHERDAEFGSEETVAH